MLPAPSPSPRRARVASRFFPRLALSLLPFPLALGLRLAFAEEPRVHTIHVVPGSHLDIGFTDTPSAVREKRIAVLDDAIATAKRDPDFRWLEESGWVVEAWRDRHAGDAGRLADLRRLLAEERIGVGAAWANPHAAAFPEFLDLLLVHHETLARELGYVPPVAVLNDVPSYPEALVDALAAGGVRYLLIGANMAFTPPLPPGLAKTPFWWESASGKRVLTWIDDDAYVAAFQRWGIDPDTARFFNPTRFPRERGPLETMEKGITEMLGLLRAPIDEVVVEHAFDNWDANSAKRLPGSARLWNEAGRLPRIAVSLPVTFFRHVEEAYGKTLPVRQGEWGGQWDALRGCEPAWTWRVREAMRRRSPDASWETRAALATAMEHSQGLGPGWGGMFDERQTVEHAREVAGALGRAVELALGKDAVAALPPAEEPPAPAPATPLAAGGDAWSSLVAPAGPRVRAGESFLGPFVLDRAKNLDAGLRCGADARRYVARFAVDRPALPGLTERSVSVVVEFPLRGAAGGLRLAPEGSPSARAGRWLLGAPPAFVVAPAGVRVTGLTRDARATSPVIFAWTLVADRADPGVTWLQGLVFRGSTRCELKGGVVKALPFAALYPGEPERLEVSAALDLAE